MAHSGAVNSKGKMHVSVISIINILVKDLLGNMNNRPLYQTTLSGGSHDGATDYHQSSISISTNNKNVGGLQFAMSSNVIECI